MTSEYDLDALLHADLLAAAKATRRAIRSRRATSEYGLYWHHADMRALLPDPSQVKPTRPESPQFIRGCVRYRQSFDQRLGEASRADVEFAR